MFATQVLKYSGMVGIVQCLKYSSYEQCQYE